MNRFNLFKLLVVFFTLAVTYSCKKDDEPINNAPKISAQSFNASEGASAIDVFGTVKATDVDGDKLVYSIVVNSNNLFEITGAGAISLATNKVLDYETMSTHSLTIQVSDGLASASAKMTINVIDIDENNSPVIADQPFSIDENSAIGVTVGTITATDSDNDTLTYSIVSTIPVNSTAFSVNSTTGEITVGSNTLNHEGQSSYILKVEVSDGSLSTSADMQIEIDDVNEVPVFGDGSTTFTVSEDIADTIVIGTLSATDEDGDTIKYTLADSSASSNFEIDVDSGELSLRAGVSLDFETRTSYSFSAGVNDGVLSATPVTIIINVTDVVESNINVSVFAGNLATGLTNGAALSAKFNSPAGMVKDAAGNIYVADTANNVIRKIDATTGTVSTYAGSGTRGWSDNQFNRLAAWFSDPTGLAIDATGNIYVADQGNHRIRKITSSGVTTVAGSGAPGFIDDNQAKLSTFNFPTSLAVDVEGNIYVVDQGNHAIRKIEASGKVTTIAGDGTAGYLDGAASQTTRLNSPVGIVIDSRLNELYIADSGNKRIRTLGFKGPNSGRLSTIITPTSGLLKPYGITLNTNDGTLYISDFNKNLIYKAEAGMFGVYTTSVLAGSMSGYLDGPGNTSRFKQPWGVLIDDSGDLLISDYGNNMIRKITETHTP